MSYFQEICDVKVQIKTETTLIRILQILNIFMLLFFLSERPSIDRYIGLPIYLADTDTDISVSANWISISAYRYRLLAR